MKITELLTEEILQLDEAWSAKYKRSIDCSRPKGFSQRAHCQGRKKNNEAVDGVTEDSMSLRDWFGKGKHGGAGGGGWDRYNTKGERIGKCGERKPGEGKPKCLSKAKAASLRASGGKKAIASAVNRKRREDPNPERKGKADMVSNRSKKNESLELLESTVGTYGPIGRVGVINKERLLKAADFRSKDPQHPQKYTKLVSYEKTPKGFTETDVVLTPKETVALANVIRQIFDLTAHAGKQSNLKSLYESLSNADEVRKLARLSLEHPDLIIRSFLAQRASNK